VIPSESSDKIEVTISDTAQGQSDEAVFNDWGTSQALTGSFGPPPEHR
jgi:hypothetical protein